MCNLIKYCLTYKWPISSNTQNLDYNWLQIDIFRYIIDYVNPTSHKVPCPLFLYRKQLPVTNCQSNESLLLYIIIYFYLTHSGQFSSRYHAHFRKYRLFTNGGAVETLVKSLLNWKKIEMTGKSFWVEMLASNFHKFLVMM